MMTRVHTCTHGRMLEETLNSMGEVYLLVFNSETHTSQQVWSEPSLEVLKT